jgi:hypothetical protein
VSLRFVPRTGDRRQYAVEYRHVDDGQAWEAGAASQTGGGKDFGHGSAILSVKVLVPLDEGRGESSDLIRSVRCLSDL